MVDSRIRKVLWRLRMLLQIIHTVLVLWHDKSFDTTGTLRAIHLFDLIFLGSENELPLLLIIIDPDALLDTNLALIALYDRDCSMIITVHLILPHSYYYIKSPLIIIHKLINAIAN